MQISIKEGDLVVTKEITAPNNEYPSAEDALLGAYDVLSRIFGQAAIVRACLRTDPDAMDYIHLSGDKN